MATIEPTLFSWQDVEATSDLDRFILVRNHLPDERIIQYLEVMRGKGRNDFPVRAMWNALIAGIVFQHPSIESFLRELARNPSLLEVCGFNPLPLQKKPTVKLVQNDDEKVLVVWSESGEACFPIPSGWNFSRFLANVIELEECLGMITGMTGKLCQELMEVLPNFGEHLGYDGKAIQSNSTGQKNRDTGKTSDLDADWGHHKTAGTDSRTGKPWSKIKSWFGYGLHLIADTHYEIPVAMHITPASASEQIELRAMIREAFNEIPRLMERCKDFSADRGLDSAETKTLLWDDYQIRPLIDTREMWRDEKQLPDYDPSKPITRPLYSDKVDSIVFTEKGTLHCICPQSGEMRDLAFQGFESDRSTLKYRCPAAAYGLECEGREACHRAGGVNPGEFGRIIRVNLNTHDRRIFTPTPHGSPSWHRGYNRRSALERINNRVDNSFGFEKHFIRGMAKMQTRVGLAIAVMMAMALGHVKAGRVEQMRSLIRPIPTTG